MQVDFTKQEIEAIYDLSKQLDLTPNQIIRQALRTYQAISKGSAKLVIERPLKLAGK
jgi:hypothetical protein